MKLLISILLSIVFFSIINSKKFEDGRPIIVTCRSQINNTCNTLARRCTDLSGALSIAGENDTIRLSQEPCTDPGNWNITTDKTVNIFSESSTTIDCGGQGFGIIFNYTESTGTVRFEGITFQNCLFQSQDFPVTRGAAIYIINGNLEMNNCSFISNKVLKKNSDADDVSLSAAIFVENSESVFINSSIFINNSNKANGTGAIYVAANSSSRDMEQMEISQSNFTGNNGSTGAVCVQAINAMLTVPLDLHSNNFTNNTGTQYGAVFVDNRLINKGFQTTITLNTFEYNYGNKTGAVEIFTANPSDLKVNLLNNHFGSNIGIAKAGAVTMQINLLEQMRYEISYNTFVNNQGHKGTVGFLVSFLLDFGTSSLTSQVSSINMVSNTFEQNFADFGGALYFQIDSTITLTDNIFTGNSAINAGAIYLSGKSTFNESGSEYRNNSAQQCVDLFARTTSLVSICNTVYHASNQDETLVQILTDTSPNLAENNKVNCPSSSIVSLEVGESHHFANQFFFGCHLCPEGTYSFPVALANLEAAECLMCPAEAVCRGGNDIRAKSGFWGTQLDPKKTDVTFFYCPNEYCITDDSYLGEYDHCSGNRAGVLCGDCRKGYTETLRMDSDCVESSQCHNQIAAYILLLLPKALIYALVLLYIPQLKSASFHIFAYFFQALSLVLPLIHTQPMDSFIDILLSFSQLVSLQSNLEIFSNFGICPSASPINAAQKIAMSLIGPFTFFIAVIFLYFILRLISWIRSYRAHHQDSDSEEPSEISLSSDEDIQENIDPNHPHRSLNFRKHQNQQEKSDSDQDSDLNHFQKKRQSQFHHRNRNQNQNQNKNQNHKSHKSHKSHQSHVHNKKSTKHHHDQDQYFSLSDHSKHFSQFDHFVKNPRNKRISINPEKNNINVNRMVENEKNISIDIDSDSDISNFRNKRHRNASPQTPKTLAEKFQQLEGQRVSGINAVEWQRAEQIGISKEDLPSEDTSSLSTLPNDEDLSDFEEPDINNLIHLFPELEKIISEDIVLESVLKTTQQEVRMFPSQRLTKRLGIALLTIGFLAYFPVLNAFANLTSCIRIPFTDSSQLRMFRFASVSCYKGWQAFLIFLVILLAVLPFVLFWVLSRKPRSKSSLTLLSSLYFPFKDRYYWFSCMMIFWRTVLIFASAYANNSSLKTFLLTSTCLLILVIHLQTKPFLLKNHNRLQTTFLLILTLISSIDLIHSTWSYGGISPEKNSVVIFGEVFRYFLFIGSFLGSFYALFLFFRMVIRSILSLKF
ncbi:g protein-coupled receptor-related [Anaeramoeba ignava]|uniref:G protein-coupled receptor-related n=1 Tax=Anaeramoeba ignava TaxID=1746090 RepID=A0A9Q0LJ56_ANAIG|nr:g protein-coupled receptor-related [Anaeramoeba ignava]